MCLIHSRYLIKGSCFAMTVVIPFIIIVISIILSHEEDAEDEEDVEAEESSALNWSGIQEVRGLKLNLSLLTNSVTLDKAVCFRHNTKVGFSN